MVWSEQIKDPNEYNQSESELYKVNVTYLNTNKTRFLDVSFVSNKNDRDKNLPDIIDWKFIKVDFRIVSIKVSFNHPLYVSSDEWDELYITVKDNSYFLRERDGRPVQEDYEV
jgi:hypothetical protein